MCRFSIYEYFYGSEQTLGIRDPGERTGSSGVKCLDFGQPILTPFDKSEANERLISIYFQVSEMKIWTFMAYAKRSGRGAARWVEIFDNFYNILCMVFILFLFNFW